jgi:uncharacterized protein DUF397
VSDHELHWFTSSFSGGNGGSCVEVAFLPGAIAVRDTKAAPYPRTATQRPAGRRS